VTSNPVADSQSLRALLVSYNFPPVGGAGVARVVKLAKFLPEYGIRPAVLTVANPSVPVVDESRLRDLPSEIDIIRVRTLEPGYGAKRAAWSAQAVRTPSLRHRAILAASSLAKQALIPDPQILWQPAAQLALLRRLVGRSTNQVIFISGPPFSQFLMALTAQLNPKVAVVLDYRDEWSTYGSNYEMRGSLGVRVGGWLEETVVKVPDAITTATEGFREHLLERFPRLEPSRVVAISNGYDPDDFPKELPLPPTDRFVVTYAGTVFRLTSLRGFVGAVRRLWSRKPDLARLLEVRIVGRVVETEEDYLKDAAKLGIVRVGYVPHDQVPLELARSHVTLCVLDDTPGVERIYPAKIFEQMYLRRPSLTLSPPGALTELVDRTQLGEVLPPRDESKICAWLEARLMAYQRGEFLVPPQPIGIEAYHRRALAGCFAEVFRAAHRRAAR